MIIAIIVCKLLIFSTLKLQQFSLITKFLDTYISSNSRYYNIRARGCIGGGHLQTDRDPTGDSFEQKKMSRGCNKDRKDALYKYKDY